MPGMQGMPASILVNDRFSNPHAVGRTSGLGFVGIVGIVDFVEGVG